VGEPQLIDAALLELQIRETACGGVPPCAVEGLPREIDADHLARRKPLRETARDAAGATAHVEQPHAGTEMRQEKRGRLLGRALPMLLERRRRVAVGVLLVSERLVGHALVSRENQMSRATLMELGSV